mgnify:CR=1 FL=1
MVGLTASFQLIESFEKPLLLPQEQKLGERGKFIEVNFDNALRLTGLAFYSNGSGDYVFAQPDKPPTDYFYPIA